MKVNKNLFMTYCLKISKKIFQILLFVGIIFFVLHLLFTGSVPLFRINRLNNSKSIIGIQDNFFILSDGQRIILPNVKYIPTNSIFEKAIMYGIEFDTKNNRAYGLLKINHDGVNNPIWYDVRKINLSALAGLLDPNTLTISTNNEATASLINILPARSKIANKYNDKGWNMTNLFFLQSLEQKMFEQNP